MESSHNRLMTLVRTLKDCCQKKEDELCRQLSLNNSQYACLLLFPASGTVGVNELSHVIDLSPSRTSRVAETLVRGGFLSRRTPESDRRSQLLRLTPKGRRAKAAIERLTAECESRLLESLPTDRIPEIQRGIEALIQAF
jgi:DNA-binding MarR family transcriptional regulator